MCLHLLIIFTHMYNILWFLGYCLLCPIRYYRLFSIFTGIFEFLADLCLCLGAWMASVMLHNYMTTNVFRNPMTFFDATPIGRILSRFSSDVEVVDKLSQQISDTVYCLMDVCHMYFIMYCFASRTLLNLIAL